ncbi:MAG: transcription termination/antitermination protein NusA [Caldilineaceae bacterium]|nr:transcription termination/antitermination protein NusA [Caldilineaceae bacterium]
MSKALIAGINQVATDKDLDREIIFEAIEAALISAYKRKYGSIANVSAEVDRVTGAMRIFTEREVVEEVFNERTEIAEADAKKVDATAELGDVIMVEADSGNFGRIAAQTAKQVILQRIREAERDTVYENFAHRVGELLNAQVRSIDTVSNAVTVLLDDRHESLLTRDEQIPGENLRRGDYVRVYVVDVHRSNRGPVIKLSRTHRNLLRRLMEQEIPEVRDGVVEIKAISREPGARSKVAVSATEPEVDAVGSCVGMRGLRIQNIVNELNGEKIDVVEWKPLLNDYIANALSPAKVNNVLLDDGGSIKTATVIVPDRQLSLAIGKEGQNARLAAKLTGWRIDIKSESEAIEEGLDRLAQAQLLAMQTESMTDDLLSKAERILQSEDSEGPAEIGEDALSVIARKLAEEADEPTIETAEMPSFADALDRLAAADAAAAGERKALKLPRFDDLMEMPTLPDEETSRSETDAEEAEEAAAADAVEITETEAAAVDLVEEAAVEEARAGEGDAADDFTSGEELPDIITADMLRERMDQRRKIELDDDFEIPAELLVGLEDYLEEDEEEQEEGDEFDKKAGKGGAKKSKRGKQETKKRPAAKKKRRPRQDNDDYNDYY